MANSTLPAPNALSATSQAVRAAAAAVLCLTLAEWGGLEHSNLAVWTTHMVMAQYAFTSFQKGVERVLGRGVGILVGVAVATWFNDAPQLGFLVLAPLLMAWFYLYFADRLAYTFLNAGLYAVVLFEIGVAQPGVAPWEGLDMFAAIALGVVVADAVTWIGGTEGELRIHVEGKPLWPLRGDWISHSLLLVVTVAATLCGTHWLGIPAEKSAVSVMLLTIAPDIQALIQKGELRIVGAMAATAWGVGMFLLVGLMPGFPMLAVLLFFGQFLAVYWARSGGPSSYAGLQMGLVLPMLVVVPPADFGSVGSAVQRIEGILTAMAASLLLGGLWPRFPLRSEPADAQPVHR